MLPFFCWSYRYPPSSPTPAPMPAPKAALPAIAPIAAPPPAPIAAPLTLRDAVVLPQPARAIPITRTRVAAARFMACPFPALFARPLGRQSPNRPEHGRIAHELLILLMRRRPVDKGLDALVAGDRLRIADQGLQVLPVRDRIMVAHDAEQKSLAEVEGLATQRVVRPDRADPVEIF